MALVFLDCETTRFFSDPDIARLPRAEQIPALAAHFGVAVTFDDAHGWRTWWPDRITDLWQALIGQQIAGWNVIHFDVPLIQQAACLAGYPDPGLDPWTALDLFAEIRTRTGRGKSGDGQSAAEWLRSGRPEMIEAVAAYCRDDVQLCIDLHALAETAGLLLPPRPRDTDLATYRYWLNADGSAWRLAVDGGEVLDGEGHDISCPS